MSVAISTISPGLAAPYSSSTTYAKDAFVLYQNKYWRCLVPITVPEPWDEDHWTEAENLLNGVNEVILGGSVEPTEGKLWVDYSDAPVPSEYALISEFNPANPAQYLRDFVNGSVVEASITSIIRSVLPNADQEVFPSIDSDSSSDDLYLLDADTPDRIESLKADFDPEDPAAYVRRFLLGSAMSYAVEYVINTELGDSSSSLHESSSDEPLLRTRAWIADFNPTTPEDYVVSFIRSGVMYDRIASILRSLYDYADEEEYPYGYESSSSSSYEDIALVSDFDPTTPAPYLQTFLHGSAMASVISEIVRSIYEDAGTTVYPSASRVASLLARASTNVARVSDFDPDDPADYLKTFIHGNAMVEAIESVLHAMYDTASSVEYPSTHDSSDS